MPQLRPEAKRGIVRNAACWPLCRYRHSGHGHRNLCSVLAILMMLAFLIDQVQERCCRVFRAAKAGAVSRTTLWRRMRSFLFVAHLTGWEDLMLRLAGEHPARPPPVGA